MRASAYCRNWFAAAVATPFSFLPPPSPIAGFLRYREYTPFSLESTCSLFSSSKATFLPAPLSLLVSPIIPIRVCLSTPLSIIHLSHNKYYWAQLKLSFISSHFSPFLSLPFPCPRSASSLCVLSLIFPFLCIRVCVCVLPFRVRALSLALSLSRPKDTSPPPLRTRHDTARSHPSESLCHIYIYIYIQTELVLYLTPPAFLRPNRPFRGNKVTLG